MPQLFSGGGLRVNLKRPCSIAVQFQVAGHANQLWDMLLPQSKPCRIVGPFFRIELMGFTNGQQPPNRISVIGDKVFVHSTPGCSRGKWAFPSRDHATGHRRRQSHLQPLAQTSRANHWPRLRASVAEVEKAIRSGQGSRYRCPTICVTIPSTRDRCTGGYGKAASINGRTRGAPYSGRATGRATKGPEHGRREKGGD